MKLYNASAGNPKRVRIFIAEKGLDISHVEMEPGSDTRTDAFRKINSLAELPVLELDDGRIITESVAICPYLEAIFPDPPLMGRDAFEQGHIEMWSQLSSINSFFPTDTMSATPSPCSRMLSRKSPPSQMQNATSSRKGGRGWTKKSQTNDHFLRAMLSAWLTFTGWWFSCSQEFLSFQFRLNAPMQSNGRTG